MEIKVKDLVGENCITREDGNKIYNLLFPQLSVNRHVTLDFSGTNIFASPFFNAGIGRLLKDFKKEQLDTLLKVNNLNPIGISLLKLVIGNSAQNYQDASYQQTVDEVLKEQEENL
jgi:hypothetical protein